MKNAIIHKRKVMTDGVPIPEMIGGAIIGALVSLVLTYVRELQWLMDPGSPALYITLAIAAVIGATLTFFLAREHVVEVNERAESPDIGSRRAA